MEREITLRLNGASEAVTTADRTTLADALRDGLGRTGTKLGCEQGVCGACTVLVDGATARACLMLAGQADGSDVLTIEGLSETAPAGRALQKAFARHDALQCGFCTPGFLLASLELLAEDELDEDRVREGLSGNLCRCTGYGGIVRAVLDVREQLGQVPLPGVAGIRPSLSVSERPPPPLAAPPGPSVGVRPTRAVVRSRAGRGVASVAAGCLAGYVLWRWWRGRRPAPLPATPLTWVYVAATPPSLSPNERRR